MSSPNSAIEQDSAGQWKRHSEDEPIVRPVVPKQAPVGGPVAVMVGTRTDLFALAQRMSVDLDSAFPLFLSRLYGVRGVHSGLFLVGPMVGAPYAVMILEALIALGVVRVLFYGWCGAVSEKVCIGDLVLPTEAHIDEGTSRHYPDPRGSCAFKKATGNVKPSPVIQKVLRMEMIRRGLAFLEGPIWSTDAIFRETKRKTVYHQRRGILAIEMEASALFSVGRFHGIQVGGFMAVSDEISSLTWRPGFKEESFTSVRRRACEVIQSVCQTL